MNDVLTGTEVATSLRLERDAVKAFVEILQKEQKALIQGGGEDLDCLASSKEQLVKQLADFGERRNRYLASRGLGTDSKGMEAWLAEGPRDTLAERPVAGTGAKARYPQAAGFTGNESARPRDTLAERPVAGTGAKARYPQAAGFAGNESACLANTKSAAVWSDLLRLARIAQQLNQTNGAIIATRLQNCQRAFAALQGAAGTTAFYGPQGQTFGMGGGRGLERI